MDETLYAHRGNLTDLLVAVEAIPLDDEGGASVATCEEVYRWAVLIGLHRLYGIQADAAVGVLYPQDAILAARGLKNRLLRFAQRLVTFGEDWTNARLGTEDGIAVDVVVRRTDAEAAMIALRESAAKEHAPEHRHLLPRLRDDVAALDSPAGHLADVDATLLEFREEIGTVLTDGQPEAMRMRIQAAGRSVPPWLEVVPQEVYDAIYDGFD